MCASARQCSGRLHDDAASTRRFGWLRVSTGVWKGREKGQGSDFAGVVAEVGPGVETFEVGMARTLAVKARKTQRLHCEGVQRLR